MPPPRWTFPRKRVCPISSFPSLLLPPPPPGSSLKALAFPSPKAHFANLHLQKPICQTQQGSEALKLLKGFWIYVIHTKQTSQTLRLKLPAFFLYKGSTLLFCGSVFL